MSARKSNSTRSEGLSHKVKYVSSAGTCRTIIHPAYARHSLYANQGNEESIYSGPCKTNSDQITRSFSTRTPLSTRLSVFVKRVDHTNHIAQVDMEKHRFVKRRLPPEVFNKLPESLIDPDGGESSCSNLVGSTALSQCPERPQNKEVQRKPKTVTRSSTPRPSYKSSPPPPPPSLGVRNDDLPCPSPIIKVIQSGSHSSARPDSKRFSQRKFLPSLPFKNLPVHRLLRFLRPQLERRNSCPSLCISELCLEPEVDLTSHPHRTAPKTADESAASISVDNILSRHPVKWTSHSELQRPEAEGYIVGLSAGEEVACSTGSDSSAGDFYDSLGSNAVTPQPSPPPQFVTCSSSGEINNIQIPSSDCSEAERCTQINKQISSLEGREELNSLGDERRSVIGSESVGTKAESDLVLISAEQSEKDEDRGCGESGIEADRSSCNDCSGSQRWDHHPRNVKDGQGLEESHKVSLGSECNTSSDYSSSCFNSNNCNSSIDVDTESSAEGSISEERRNSADSCSQILTDSNSRVRVQLDRSDNCNQSVSNNSSVCTQQGSRDSNQSDSSNNICAQLDNNSESCNQSHSKADYSVNSSCVGSDCNANFQHLGTCLQRIHSNSTAFTTSDSENNNNYHLEDKKICFDVCSQGVNEFSDCAQQLTSSPCDQTANKTDCTQRGNETNPRILLGNCSESVNSNNESDLQLSENIIDSSSPKSQSDSLFFADNCDRVTSSNSGINSDWTLPDQNQDGFVAVDASSVDRNKKTDLVQSDSNGNSIQPDNRISCLVQFENSNPSVQSINSPPCLQGDCEDIADTDSTSNQKEFQNGDNYNSNSSSSSQRTDCDNSDNNEACFRNDDSFQANNRCENKNSPKSNINNSCIDHQVNNSYTDLKGNNSDNSCTDIEVNKTSDNNRCTDIEANKTSDNNRCTDIEVNKTSDNNRCTDIEVNKTSDNNRCTDIEVNKTSDNNSYTNLKGNNSDNSCTDIEVNKTSDNNNRTDIEANKTSDNINRADIEANKTSDSNRCTDIQVNNSDNNNIRTDNKGNDNSDINSKSSSHTGNNNSVCIGSSVEEIISCSSHSVHKTAANNPFLSVTQEDIVNNNSPCLPTESFLNGSSSAVTNIECNGDSDLRFEVSSCDTSDHNSSAAARDNNNISYLEVGDYSSHYTNSKSECNNISLLQVDSGSQTVVSNQHNNNDSSSDFVKSGDNSTNIQAQSNINTQSSNHKSINNTLVIHGSSYHTDTIPRNGYPSDNLHHSKDNNITTVPLGDNSSPSQPVTDSSNSTPQRQETYNSNNNRADKEQHFNNSRSYSQPSNCENSSSDNNSASLCHVSNFSEDQEQYDPNNSLISINSASQNHYNSCIEIKNSGGISRGTLISVNGNHSTGEPRHSYYPVNEANARNTLIKVNDFTAGLGNRHDSLDFGERHSSSSTSELCSADINECYNVKLDAPQEVIVAGFHDFCHTMLSVEDSSLESQDSGKDSQRGCDGAYETANGSLSEEVSSSCSSRYPRNDCVENNNCNGHCQTKPSYLLTSLSKLTQNCKDPLKKTGSHPSGRLESSSDNLLEEIQKSKLMEKKMNIADAEVIEAIRQLDRSLVDASVSSGDVSTNNFTNHQSTTLEPKRQANVILEIKNHPKVSRDDKVQCDNLIEEVMLEDISKRITNSGPLPSPYSRGGIAVTISNAKTHHLQSPHNQAVTTFQRIPANHKQSGHMGTSAHTESKNLHQELNSMGQTSTNIRVEDCRHSSSPNSTCTFTSHSGSVCSFAPQADKPRSTSIPCTQQHEETKKMNAIPDGREDAISLPVTFTQDASRAPHPPTTPLQVSVDMAPAPHGVQDVVACHRTSPCSVDSGTSSHNQGYFVVVAIDFGTTYSGYAFSFTRDPDNVHMMKKWDGGDPGVFNQKTPTTLLLTPEGTFHSFGYSARDYYHDLDTEEAKRWMYFDKFKMALHHSEHLSLDTEIKSANGRAMPAISVFAHALRYFKDHALQELSEQSATRILNEDVRWVVTVPAIWKQPAKQFMRAAAYKAGIASSEFPDQLLIALEPEAASIYCRRMRLHQLVPDDSQMQRASFRWQKEEQETECSTLADKGPSNMPSMPRHHPDNSFTTGTKYMVVDCGGGTVDITVHELLDTHGTLKELQKASGGPYGSIGVDMDFERLLCDIFGAEFISQFKLKRPTGFVDLMIAFEARKRNASPYKSNPLNISLPFSFIDYYKKYKGSSVESAIKKSCHKDVKWSSQGMLRLEQSAMESLFHRTVKQIREHIESIVTLPELNIDHLFLVGGFAESLILQKEIRDYFSPKIKVIIPHGVSLAILKGAVLFGLDPTIVNIRRLRMTYGVGVLNRFIHGVHPKEKLVIKDGIQWCADVFDKFVVTDQSVGLGDVVVRSYTPAKAGQSCSVIHIYCSEKDNVYFITDPGVKRCATLILDLSDSRYIQSREIQTRMMFGDTEIKVSALDVITGKCVKSEVDFLGH